MSTHNVSFTYYLTPGQDPELRAYDELRPNDHPSDIYRDKADRLQCTTYHPSPDDEWSGLYTWSGEVWLDEEQGAWRWCGSWTTMVALCGATGPLATTTSRLTPVASGYIDPPEVLHEEDMADVMRNVWRLW